MLFFKWGGLFFFIGSAFWKTIEVGWETSLEDFVGANFFFSLSKMEIPWRCFRSFFSCFFSIVIFCFFFLEQSDGRSRAVYVFGTTLNPEYLRREGKSNSNFF